MKCIHHTLILTVFTTIFIISALTANAQKHSAKPTGKPGVLQKSSASKISIQKKLQRLSDWRYDEEPDFNVDSFSKVLNSEMLAYLTKRPFPAADSKLKLERITTSDRLLTIYNYSYSSGGTAGNLYTAIVQWKKPDGKYGAALLDVYDHFYESHILSRSKEHNLYLFIGTSKGSSRIACAEALVLQLSGDRLNLNYPAFYNQYPVLSYNDDIYTPESPAAIAEIVYNAEKRRLIIKDLGSDDEVGPKRKNDSGIQNVIKGRNSLSYTFNGKKFIENP